MDFKTKQRSNINDNSIIFATLFAHVFDCSLASIDYAQLN